MNQHTPGPWKAMRPIENKFARNHWTIEAASPHVKGHAQTVCELNGPWKPENYAANARLIAAAPELLEACRGIIALANDPAGSTFKLREAMREIEFTRAIATIAKATGKGEA